MNCFHNASQNNLIDGLRLRFALSCFRSLSPHFLHVFQHHIAVSVKGLHTSQKLTIVPAVDENLRCLNVKNYLRILKFDRPRGIILRAQKNL